MRGRRTLSWLVVVALLVATAFATLQAWQMEREDADEANAAVAHQAATAAQQEVALLAAGLRGGEAIVRDDGTVGEEEFRSFARDVLRRTRFPALAFATVVDAAEREAFEAALGAPITRPGEGGRRPPARERPEHAPITAVHPRAPLGVELIGLDLLAEPRRRAAALAARDSGEPRLSAPVPQASSGSVGATLFSPAYAAGAPRGEMTGRRSGLVGFFSAGVSGRRLASTAKELARVSGAVQIRDRDELLAGPAAMPDDAAADEIQVLGRRWTVSVAPEVEPSLTPPLAFAVSGIALSLLAAGLLWAAGRRERELYERQRSVELQAARESLLTRIADSLEREMEVDARLASLARILVPAVGEICSVHVVTAEGAVRRAGIAATDPQVERVLREMGTPAATNPVRAAIASREPVLYTRVSSGREARLRDATPPWPPRDEGELRAGIGSSMIVPLVARERVLGAISLAIPAASGRPPFRREDIAFVSEVASHAAVALDNARLYEQQRDIAGVLQGALLPPRLPEIAGLEVAARHRPGLTGTEIGGDFYDLFESEGRWIAVVGDVCGKGPAAAALTALVRYTIRATAHEGPEVAVARVHEAIRASQEHTYCTLCCAELTTTADGVAARVTTAGHPEPRIVAADGSVRRLDVTGPLVGALDNPSFGAQPFRLAPGELLFMCSDGVPEARRNGEVFGDGRLEELLGRLAPLSPEDLLVRLEAEVVHFVAGRPRDDLALFALRAR